MHDFAAHERHALVKERPPSVNTRRINSRLTDRAQLVLRKAPGHAKRLAFLLAYVHGRLPSASWRVSAPRRFLFAFVRTKKNPRCVLVLCTEDGSLDLTTDFTSS